MRKYLLPQSGQFYKANLHCHTTVSDGLCTPAEVKESYKARGYSIVAYTDHDVMVPHPELQDEEFLPLIGYEMEINDESDHRPFPQIRCCHMCLIALTPDVKQVCYHRDWYIWGNALNYRDSLNVDPNEPDYVRHYSAERISDMMKRGRDGGFFVTYNHPGWSLESYPEYSGYEGMHAMEMYNYGCLSGGYEDYNPRVYDDLLRQGKRIWCTAGDDNHNPASDCFGAFTMIKADSLDYTTVTKALMDGHFYVSEGPEIYDLWYEDGKVGIRCSAARRIDLHTGIRFAGRRLDEKATLTEAVFTLPSDYDVRYFRLTVTDAAGRTANTNAYWPDELK